MINRPKYKTARRLGASVFDKTQTPKFALRSERGEKKGAKKPRPKSDFGIQMLEKQKAKVTYGITEKMFRKYVMSILTKKTGLSQSERLMAILESRLDNVVYRLGLASTRQASRQMVSHGHICVNGRRVDIPSYQVHIGDVLTIREGSKTKAIFKDLEEKLKSRNAPAWLSFDLGTKTAKVEGVAKVAPIEINFDIAAVLNFYSR